MPKSYSNVYGTSRAKGNFLASEVGKRLETRDMTAYAATLGVDVVDPSGATVKVIKAGYIYPSNASGAQGIVFEDVYPDAEGHYIGSLLTAGKVWGNRLSVVAASGAKSSLPYIEFKDHPEMTRPDFGTTELTELEAPTNLSAATNILGWTGSDNTEDYAILINGEAKATSFGATRFDPLSGIAKAGDKVSVMALGDYITYKNSEKSEEITIQSSDLETL